VLVHIVGIYGNTFRPAFR